MPRPTAAQLVYGSCTVILSTLAMLLLSGTGSAAGISFIAVTGFALGLLVALTVPVRRPARRGRSTIAAQHSPASQEPMAATSAASSDT
ncbi:hypothetical protein ABZZ79_20340 [Streptomyces sp. NPDC006458]|uniref:hypothetical protein n=1 Tax=Streptomyces sp. NPDC006458 TaxID=3154302 RepID=UPI0033B4EA6A